MCKKYKKPVRFWLFQKFIVFAMQPADIEILMTSPQTVDRGEISTIITNTIEGDGLFTAKSINMSYNIIYIK